MVEHFGILFETKSAFLICLYLFLSDRKNTSSLLTIRINVFLLIYVDLSKILAINSNKEYVFIRKKLNN